MKLDWSATGWARVVAITVIGTLACIVVAFAYDSYSFDTGTWRWGGRPLNNVIIPLILAPPLLLFLLSKMRELAIAHEELLAIATTDSLTSLLNRRAFTEMVDGYLARVGESPTHTTHALLVIDVDHFKAVNDRYGHDSGDEALKLIADAISANVADTDLVGRMGGEEFCIFIPRKPVESIPVTAERLRSAITELSFVPGGKPHALSISIGGVIFAKGKTFSDLYRAADRRLYLAKKNGRNRTELHTLGSGTSDEQTLH